MGNMSVQRVTCTPLKTKDAPKLQGDVSLVCLNREVANFGTKMSSTGYHAVHATYVVGRVQTQLCE